MSRIIRTPPRTAPPPPPPARRTSRETAKGFVSTQVKDRRSVWHDEKEDFDVYTQTFSEDNPPAYVKAGAGLTINLGHFESLRIDCSVSLPVDRQKIEEGFDEATEIVFRRISEEQARWLGESAAKPRGKAA